MVLTDKTGTLTENKMMLRSCSVYGQTYQQVIDYQAGTVTPNKSLLDKLSGKTVILKDERRIIEQFLLGLALCNTVTVGLMNTGM